MSSIVDDPVDGVLGALAAVIDEVEVMPVGRCDAAGHLAVLERLEESVRRLSFCGLRVVRSAQDAGAATAIGAPSMTALLQSRLRLSGSEAAGRVRAAQALCASRSLTGIPIPPPLPGLAAAAAAGQVSAEQVAIVLRTMDRLPAGLDGGLRTSVEATMVEHARTFAPRELAGLGKRIEYRLTPAEPDPGEVARRRGLSFVEDLPGSVAIHGICSTATAAILRTAIEPFAKPLPHDDRTATQRRIDALEELARHALDSGNLPTVNGERPHVSILLEATDPTTAELSWVGPVRRDSIDWLLCDAITTPVEVDGNGVPRRIGEPSRTPPLRLRRAVIARDRGCTFPGCDRPPAWTDFHHVTHWEHGGPHAYGNLVLLCGYHHKLVHDQRWRIDFINRFPHYTAPAWIDPRQTPRRNDIHHLRHNLPLRT